MKTDKMGFLPHHTDKHTLLGGLKYKCRIWNFKILVGKYRKHLYNFRVWKLNKTK